MLDAVLYVHAVTLLATPVETSALLTVTPVVPYKLISPDTVRELLIVTDPPRLLLAKQLKLFAPTQALKFLVGLMSFMFTLKLPLP